MATDTPTANTSDRVDIARAVIVIADLFKSGVSSVHLDHLDATTSEKASCDAGARAYGVESKPSTNGAARSGDREPLGLLASTMQAYHERLQRGRPGLRADSGG